MNYYNEFDANAAEWLRELIAAGQIPEGEVDERSIVDVEPVDLAGFTQCHFFAGIGGWPYALRLAGWDDRRPVWTGSPPCQPFSAAGKREGAGDERHLWPVFARLIEKCRPPTVFGEQVASADGRSWFAAVRSDLDEMGYAAGAADLCAAGIGAPHIRQRLFWVAHGERQGLQGSGGHREARAEDGATGRSGDAGGISDAADDRPNGSGSGDAGTWRQRCAVERDSSWDDVVYIPCADGKARPLPARRNGEGVLGEEGPIKPGIEPLVNGFPGRVGLLRGYGNAIVPQVAQAFIETVMECR